MAGLTIALALALAAASAGGDVAPNTLDSRCELHVWSTGENFSTEWHMAGPYGSMNGSISTLTGTIQNRMDTVLTANSQIEAIGSLEPGQLLGSDRFSITYDGAVSLEKLEATIKAKTRLGQSVNPCYVDLIVGGNGYQDMMMGRRRLYTMIHLHQFSGSKIKSRRKQMIDPLNEIDDMYAAGNVGGMDAEITASFKNNVREFLVESAKFLSKP